MGETATGRRPAGLLPEFPDDAFSAWVELLEQRVGISIPPERKSFLASGIRARMRETGCRSYRDYYRRLEADHFQAREWSLLVDQLTVHETCFFRHAASMRLVEEIVLPEAFANGRNFSAWSVGCASGEEVWSLAMIADDWCSHRERESFFGITGTDISLPALGNAREGIYLNRRMNDISEAFRRRYCRPADERHFRICERLRKRVCFSQLNLRDVAQAPFTAMDLIYCQNLLIYFGRKRRQEIAAALAGFLRPGGVLVLGPGELSGWEHPGMVRVRYEDTLAFRRSD